MINTANIKPWHFFAVCVVTWGTTWYAILYQLNTTPKVPPEVSVAYRYLLACALLFIFCKLRGLNLQFNRAQHFALAAQGVTMYSLSYICVYYAERYIPSGLVAVGYSAMPLLNGVGALVFLGTAMTARVVLGGVIGLLGVVLIFSPEFAKASQDARTITGAVFTIAAVLISCSGNIVATRNRNIGLPVWQTMAWGMMYGAIIAVISVPVLAWLDGRALPGFVVVSAPSYWASLVYLAIFGSIVAFGCYLNLLGLIGPARSSYIGVMVPIVALLVSAALEGFKWQALTYVGVALGLAGNVLMLKSEKAQAA
jgi:drug/metabolite transporter (DMT)-like permease